MKGALRPCEPQRLQVMSTGDWHITVLPKHCTIRQQQHASIHTENIHFELEHIQLVFLFKENNVHFEHEQNTFSKVNPNGR